MIVHYCKYDMICYNMVCSGGSKYELRVEERGEWSCFSIGYVEEKKHHLSGAYVRAYVGCMYSHKMEDVALVSKQHLTLYYIQLYYIQFNSVQFS